VDAFDLNNDGFINESEFRCAIANMEYISFGGPKFIEEDLELKKLLALKTKELRDSSHKADIQIGDTSNVKTKLEFKYGLHGPEEDKHFHHIGKNLHFNTESVGFILRIHSSNAVKASAELQNIVIEAKGFAEAMLPPESPILRFLKDSEIEVTHDEEIVSIGIKFKDDCDSPTFLQTLLMAEKYYQHFQFFAHFGIEFKHDINSIFGESKKLTSLVTDGVWLFAHMKTNYDDVLKTIMPKLSALLPPKVLDPIYAIVQVFFQKDFNFQLKMDELNLEEVVDQNYVEVFAVDTATLSSLALYGLSPVAAVIKNPPIPLIAGLVEILKSYCKANFSLSIFVAETVCTLHLKTSGVKELIEKAIEIND